MKQIVNSHGLIILILFVS